MRNIELLVSTTKTYRKQSFPCHAKRSMYVCESLWNQIINYSGSHSL